MPIHLAHLAIAAIALASFVSLRERKTVLSRGVDAWIVDLTSLGMHFIVLPALQTLFVFSLLSLVAPQAKGTVGIGWGLSLLAYLAIDYAWYWNHRAFHSKTKLWNLHQVHHSPKHLDLFASSKNSVWSHFFMVYFWFVPIILYLAVDPVPFLSFAAFGLVVNFWGHTSFMLKPKSRATRFFSLFLVQPEDHFWHHSVENSYCNFGTVLNFWDRLHGTWYRPERVPLELGFDLEMSTARKLLFPF